ncbi:imm11 family protein [Paenibacillus massiliensis]|uniref:imm11 family protein n=1 Tax=Paenibacillus massiliensis TaxID=225917 RepID=UPI00046F7EF7|nr:DUF1629 domain-containing protein [Paenibacillus massiliensis]
MKIWKIGAGDSIGVGIEDDLNPDIRDLLRSISFGEKINHQWKPLNVFHDKEMGKGKYSYFPRLTPGKLVLNDEALSILKPLIVDLVEILPLQNDKYNFFICNVTNILDCLDHTKSVPIISRASNKVFSYEHMYLHKDLVVESERRHIFKIPELVRTEIYVSDEFRNAVLEAGLKGLNFNLVWDSEFTKEDELAQKERYDHFLAELEKNKGIEMDWNTAMKLLNEGKAVASAHWKLKKDENKELQVGNLTYDLDYDFAKLVYIPPILLDLKWHEVERGE